MMMFAAGQGLRLLPFTSQHPKPTIPLLQVPLGYYLLPYLSKLSVSQLVINTFHLPQLVHQLYDDCKPALSFAENLTFSDEQDYIKGSGGGLKLAEELLQGDQPIVACNSDEVIFTEDENFVAKALQQHQEKKSFATLVVTRHPLVGTKFGGIWADDDGNVLGIGKESPRPGTTPWHFIGIQILDNKILDYILPTVEVNIFYGVMVNLLQDKDIRIFPLECDWYETGNIVDYTEAKAQITKNLETKSFYQKHFKELETLAKLSRLQISDLA